MSRSASEWSLRRGESSSLRSREGHNVGSPGKLQQSVSTIDTTEVRYAGEASIYYDEEVGVVLRIVACIARPHDVCSMRLTFCFDILNFGRASYPGRKA
jgi:hypothetical protein